VYKINFCCIYCEVVGLEQCLIRIHVFTLFNDFVYQFITLLLLVIYDIKNKIALLNVLL